MRELLQPPHHRRGVQHHVRPVNPFPAHPIIDQSTTASQKVRNCHPP